MWWRYRRQWDWRGAITHAIMCTGSPYMDVFCGHNHDNTVQIILDSGATGNMIKSSVAWKVGAEHAEVTLTNQSAHQADGSSPLNVTGDTRLELSHDNKKFYLDVLVVGNLDVDLLAGTPFMEANDISLQMYFLPDACYDPPESVGIRFAADVMHRNRQLIFVLGECATSFTVTCFIPDERSDSLREATISTCAPYCPLYGPPAVIRTDPAPAFVSLSNDHTLDRRVGI